MKDCKDYKKGCKYCKHNRERNLKQKTCKKGYKVIYGFSCREYEPYSIGHQFSIYDFIEE